MTAALAAVIFLLALALAAIQIASDGIFKSAAAPFSLPSYVSPNVALAIYRRAASIAPAPYAQDMLARIALSGGNLAAAKTYADRLPAGSRRDDLLGRIALARGDAAAARRLFVAAGDVQAVDRDVDGLSYRNPAAAYALERALEQRLARDGTHPDAVAEAYWRMGVLAQAQHRSTAALRDYRNAVRISPLSGKYLVAAAFQAYELGGSREALRYFESAIGVDPANAIPYAGAGMAELALGNRARALSYAARSRALDARSRPLQTLESQLK